MFYSLLPTPTVSERDTGFVVFVDADSNKKMYLSHDQCEEYIARIRQAQMQAKHGNVPTFTY